MLTTYAHFHSSYSIIFNWQLQAKLEISSQKGAIAIFALFEDDKIKYQNSNINRTKRERMEVGPFHHCYHHFIGNQSLYRYSLSIDRLPDIKSIDL